MESRIHTVEPRRRFSTLLAAPGTAPYRPFMNRRPAWVDHARRAASPILLVAGVLAALPPGAAVHSGGGAAHSAPPPTWADGVAQLLHARCVECHRPEGSAPFSLIAYADAAPRAKRIAAVTERRYMPPWLPAQGVGEFEGERRLDRMEIDLLRQWAETGAPEGDPAAAPAPPSLPGGWSLGDPDLIVEFPELTVPAEGRDVYRNLVVRAPGTDARWVRTAELRPGSLKVVHHAHLMVDTTDSSRQMAAMDSAAALEMMHVSGFAHNPGGFFIGWTPGASANPGRDDLAWRLTPGTDLMLQLHLRPTGEPETVRPRVGLHFASGPPSRTPALILLESRAIDLQPGDTASAAGDAYRVPVPVEVLAVYPHAHYLGKRMEGWAVLPSGRRRDLLRIDSWDFNFQDQYRYRRPVQLPAGSLISMRITFDNSADNPHNPFDPPRRIVRGLASTDEMAEMGFQVLPSTPADLATLEGSLDRFYYEAELRWEADEHLAHARMLESEGRLDEALEGYRSALLMGDDPAIMASMAEILLRKGDASAAVLVARRAAAVGGGADPRILWMLARASAAAGDMESARDAAKRAWEVADRLGARALADSLMEVRRSLGGGPP